MKLWLRSVLFSFLGVVISTFCAIVLARLYTGTAWKIAAPLLFAIALVLLASHFGAVISVGGAIAGAAAFAFFLYNPENSFRVNDEAERSVLAWMMLTSIALSYLLYPTRSVRTRIQAQGAPLQHANSHARDSVSPRHANDSRAGDPVGHTNSGAAENGNTARVSGGDAISKSSPITSSRD